MNSHPHAQQGDCACHPVPRGACSPTPTPTRSARALAVSTSSGGHGGFVTMLAGEC